MWLQTKDAPLTPTENPSRRWGLTEAFGAVALTLVVQVLGALLLVAVVHVLARTIFRGLRHLSGRSELWFEVATYQFLALGVLLSAIFLILVRYRLTPRALGFRFPGWGTMTKAALGIIPIFVSVVVVSAFFDRFVPGFRLQGNAQQLLSGASPNINIFEAIAVTVFLAIEAPLVEETLFRGILFQGLRHFFERYLPRWAAVFAGAVLSGTVFGLLHAQPHTLPILIVVGVAFAYVFYLTGSVYASALVHGIFNFVALVSTFHIRL